MYKSNKNRKVARKIGNSHHVNDCIRPDMKRNRKEKIENGTMYNNNENNNDYMKLTVQSASIKYHTNQDCDLDNDLFSPCNHENSRCKEDNVLIITKTKNNILNYL